MKIRYRALGVLALSPLVLGLIAPSASARTVPGVPFTVELPAGEGCAFPIVLTGHDDTTLTEKPNGAAHTEGYIDAVISNPANGKHVFRIFDGPGDFSPDGTTIYARGAWLGTEHIPGHPVRFLFSDGTKYRISLATGRIYKRSADTTVENICKLID